MKSGFYRTGILILSLLLVFSACEKEEEEDTTPHYHANGEYPFDFSINTGQFTELSIASIVNSDMPEEFNFQTGDIYFEVEEMDTGEFEISNLRDQKNNLWKLIGVSDGKARFQYMHGDWDQLANINKATLVFADHWFEITIEFKE